MNFLLHNKQTNNMNTLLTCLEVFIGRMLDVSIGSIRTIYLVKGKNYIACILAFIEILIWFFIAREILINKELNFFIITSYAGGYAFGTYVGGLINKYFVKGTLTAMIISTSSKDLLIKNLKDANFGVSVIPLEDDKNMLLIEFNKKYMKKLQDTIKRIDSHAFIIINETLNVQNGYIV